VIRRSSCGKMFKIFLFFLLYSFNVIKMMNIIKINYVLKLFSFCFVNQTCEDAKTFLNKYKLESLEYRIFTLPLLNPGYFYFMSLIFTCLLKIP
jgi:hypothetical protein